MLTDWDNFALVQSVQFLVLAFFVVLCGAVVAARLHLPKTRWEPVLDVLMVLVILGYALTLRIYFST